MLIHINLLYIKLRKTFSFTIGKILLFVTRCGNVYGFFKLLTLLVPEPASSNSEMQCFYVQSTLQQTVANIGSCYFCILWNNDVHKNSHLLSALQFFFPEMESIWVLCLCGCQDNGMWAHNALP